MTRTFIYFLLNILINILILGLTFVNEYHYIYAYIPVLTFTFFLVSLAKSATEYALTTAYTLQAVYSALLITIFLEYGVFLIEVNSFTSAVNLPAKAAIQLSAFIYGGYISFFVFNKTSLRVLNLSKRSDYIIKTIFYTIIVLFSIILLYISVKYGTPSTHGLHRNDYWTFIAPSWGSALVYGLIQLTFFLGLSFSRKANKFDLSIFLLIFFIITLLGERLTGLVYSLFFFLLPWAINKTKINVKILTPKFIFLIALSLIVISIILFKNFVALGNENAIEAVTMRAALQPQMWWALDNISNNSPRDLSLIYGKYFGFGESARYSGTYYLMDQVATPGLVTARFETASKFTLSGFFNNVYFFGYFIGFFINIIWGLLFGFLSYLLYIGIKSKNYLFSIVSFKFFYKVQAILLVASIPDLFTISSLVFIFIMIFFLRLRQVSHE